MTITEELEKLDEEMKQLKMPPNQQLPEMQKKLWEIADRHNTDGADIFMLYMNMKSKKVQ